MTDETRERVFAGYETGVPRNIAERLIALRRRQRMSASDLARKSNVSRSNISRIESGRHEPSASTIEKLAAALDVQPGDLLSQKDPTLLHVSDVHYRSDADARTIAALLKEIQPALTKLQGALRLIDADPTLAKTERLQSLLRIAEQQLAHVSNTVARRAADEEAENLTRHLS